AVPRIREGVHREDDAPGARNENCRWRCGRNRVHFGDCLGVHVCQSAKTAAWPLMERFMQSATLLIRWIPKSPLWSGVYLVAVLALLPLLAVFLVVNGFLGALRAR